MLYQVNVKVVSSGEYSGMDSNFESRFDNIVSILTKKYGKCKSQKSQPQAKPDIYFPEVTHIISEEIYAWTDGFTTIKAKIQIDNIDFGDLKKKPNHVSIWFS